MLYYLVQTKICISKCLFLLLLHTELHTGRQFFPPLPRDGSNIERSVFEMREHYFEYGMPCG